MILPNSVGSALTRFKDHSETPTVLSVLRLHYPETEWMSIQERITYFNTVSLVDLRQTLNAEQTGWAPSMATAFEAKGLVSDTYQRQYPRVMRRFIERGLEVAPAGAPSPEILPEWKAMQRSMDIVIPGDAEHLRRMLAAGITSFGTYQIANQTYAQVTKRLQNIRSNFNRLAKQCSERDLTPLDFAQTVLIPRAFKAIPMLSSDNICYYNARMVWNSVLEADPSLNLPYWGDRRVVVSLPPESYPDQLIEGYEESVFEGRSRSDKTWETYWGTWHTYLGVLESEGFSLMRLTKGLGTKDAMRLVCQGFPRELLTGDPAKDNSYALARRLVEDRAFRDEVLAKKRSFDGAYHGIESIINPFVDIAIKIRREKEQYSANRNLAMRISFIAKHYLAMRQCHYAWIAALLEQVNAEEEAHQTAYDDKKEEAFKHPRTWLKLWEGLQVVVSDLLDGAAHPTLEWAHEVSDVTLFFIMLLYPMRREQFNMMLLSPVRPGQHDPEALLPSHRKELDKKGALSANFDPGSYDITFEKHQVKNKRRIHYVIPERGRGNLCRELIDVYLRVARPMKLQGRRSPYMFFPEAHVATAGIHLRTSALNDILPRICRAYFADVLPPSLLKLNPHLMRHIVASHALVIHKNLALAAMLLNDEPETVLSHYSDVLQCSKDELRAHYETDIEVL